MMCAAVTPIVHGLEKEYGSKMTFKVRDWQDGDAPDLIVKYDLHRHGMVITDAKGKKLWGSSGHEQTKEEIEKAIKDTLGS